MNNNINISPSDKWLENLSEAPWFVKKPMDFKPPKLRSLSTPSAGMSRVAPEPFKAPSAVVSKDVIEKVVKDNIVAIQKSISGGQARREIEANILPQIDKRFVPYVRSHPTALDIKNLTPDNVVDILVPKILNLSKHISESKKPKKSKK